MKRISHIEKIFLVLLTLSFLIGILCFSAETTKAEDRALLKGTVFDIKAVPVEDAEIFIYDSPDVRRPPDFISSKTKKDGTFQMSLPAGTFWAVARIRSGDQFGPLKPGDKHSGDPVEIELALGEELVQDFTIVDIRETSRLKKKTREDYVKIKGRVLDKNNAAAEKVYIIANKNKECPVIPDYLSAWTDTKGYYTLYIPKGKYYVGYASSFPPNHDCRFYSEAVFDADEIDFVIIIDKSE